MTCFLRQKSRDENHKGHQEPGIEVWKKSQPMAVMFSLETEAEWNYFYSKGPMPERKGGVCQRPKWGLQNLRRCQRGKEHVRCLCRDSVYSQRSTITHCPHQLHKVAGAGNKGSDGSTHEGTKGQCSTAGVAPLSPHRHASERRNFLQSWGAVSRGEETSVRGRGGRGWARGHLLSRKMLPQLGAAIGAPAMPVDGSLPPLPPKNAGCFYLGAAARHRRVVGRRGGHVQVALLLGLPVSPREAPGARRRPRLLHVPLLRARQPPPPTAPAWVEPAGRSQPPGWPRSLPRIPLPPAEPTHAGRRPGPCRRPTAEEEVAGLGVISGGQDGGRDLAWAERWG